MGQYRDKMKQLKNRVLPYIDTKYKELKVYIKENPPQFIAISFGVLLILWIITGGFEFRSSDSSLTEKAQATGSQAAKIRYIHSKAELYTRTFERGGTTYPESLVTIKSQISGTIVFVADTVGKFINKGEPLVKIDVREHAAKRRELEAKISQLKLEKRAAKQLSTKGFQSELELSRKVSQLASLETALALLSINEDRSEIKSPVSGYYEDKFVSKGSWLRPGEKVALIAKLDPLNVKVTLSEQEINQISNNTKVTVEISGVEYEGKIKRISFVGNNKSRSFTVEVSIDNTDLSLKAGYSAIIHFFTTKVLAHQVEPSWLTLNDDGEIGIKTLDSNGVIKFKPIEIIGNDKEQLWVRSAKTVPENKQLLEKEDVVTLGLESSPIDSKPTKLLDVRYKERQ